MLGWAIQLTFSLRQNKTDHAAMDLALANLKEGQETLEKEVSAMGIIVGKNDDRVDGLTQVIRDNTHAMNKLVTLIEVMNERLRKD